MSNPKPDFSVVLAVNATQTKVESQDISKSQLLSFFQNIYNCIKFSNQNVKKRRESSNKLHHTLTENTSTSNKTLITRESPITFNYI